jgi:hypothetical protein
MSTMRSGLASAGRPTKSLSVGAGSAAAAASPAWMFRSSALTSLRPRSRLSAAAASSPRPCCASQRGDSGTNSAPANSAARGASAAALSIRQLSPTAGRPSANASVMPVLMASWFTPISPPRILHSAKRVLGASARSKHTADVWGAGRTLWARSPRRRPARC